MDAEFHQVTDDEYELYLVEDLNAMLRRFLHFWSNYKLEDGSYCSWAGEIKLIKKFMEKWRREKIGLWEKAVVKSMHDLKQ